MRASSKIKKMIQPKSIIQIIGTPDEFRKELDFLEKTYGKDCFIDAIILDRGKKRNEEEEKKAV